MVWEADWDIFTALIASSNVPDIRVTRSEYMEECRKFLKDNFGHAGVLE
jgi:hypothetical protein